VGNNDLTVERIKNENLTIIDLIQEGLDIISQITPRVSYSFEYTDKRVELHGRLRDEQYRVPNILRRVLSLIYKVVVSSSTTRYFNFEGEEIYLNYKIFHGSLVTVAMELLKNEKELLIERLSELDRLAERVISDKSIYTQFYPVQIFRVIRSLSNLTFYTNVYDTVMATWTSSVVADAIHHQYFYGIKGIPVYAVVYLLYNVDKISKNKTLSPAIKSEINDLFSNMDRAVTDILYVRLGKVVDHIKYYLDEIRIRKNEHLVYWYIDVSEYPDDAIRRIAYEEVDGKKYKVAHIRKDKVYNVTKLIDRRWSIPYSFSLTKILDDANSPEDGFRQILTVAENDGILYFDETEDDFIVFFPVEKEEKAPEVLTGVITEGEIKYYNPLEDFERKLYRYIVDIYKEDDKGLTILESIYTRRVSTIMREIKERYEFDPYEKLGLSTDEDLVKVFNNAIESLKSKGLITVTTRKVTLDKEGKNETILYLLRPTKI